MVAEPRTIVVDPESELGHAIDDADGAPILLQRGADRFRLVRVAADRNQDEEERETVWASYDPDRLLAALEQVQGVFTPEEGDRLKELVYRAREEGTRPIDRP